ncbi:unnamed protein product [Prorocentrum cordatum]|uniref:Reverse transcriptase Ty1/copia-type domain-containing protein n=1 Tax=Prorocentrum cordatum TaxID=2364126 RepID=A0ABN9TYR4_9DINO|nr:unnamed protein product [Polarella glacialis]
MREDAATSSNKVTQLQLLVNTELSGKWETYVEDLMKFLFDVNRYQEKFSEMISDTLIQAMIKKNTPGPLRTQVMMFTAYQTLRETCESFAQQMSQRDTKTAQKKFDPNAMGVDAFGKGGKGDSKGKGYGRSDMKGGKAGGQRGAGGRGGKSDGKGKTNCKKGAVKYFDGWCSNPHCGKYGRKMADCRKYGGGACQSGGGQRSVSEVQPGSSQRPGSGTASTVHPGDSAPQMSVPTQATTRVPGRVQAAVLPEDEAGWMFAFTDDHDWGECEMLVDSGVRAHVVPKTMTEGCELTGEPGQSLRSIIGKGIRTWGKRTLTGEVFDSNTTISAELNDTPAEVRRGALSVAEMNDAGYSVHFGPDGAKMFRGNKNVQHEIDKALESTVSLKLRRKVNAFLLPMRFKDPTGDESIIGDVDEQPETEGRPPHLVIRSQFKRWENLSERTFGEAVYLSRHGVRTGYLMKVVVEAKGGQSYAIAATSEFLDELGYMSMDVQLDGEPALGARMNGVVSERIKKLGKGAAEELRLAPYTSPMLEFGETVIGKEHTAPQDKLGTAWCKGMRLGRSTKSDAHIIGAATGILQARTVKQLTKEESFNTEILRAMRWTPWKTSVKAGAYDGEDWQPTEGCPGREYAAKGQHAPRQVMAISKHQQGQSQRKVEIQFRRFGSRRIGLVGAIEGMSTEDLKRLAAGFSTVGMMRLVAELDKETKDDSECSVVMGWAEDDEWEAKQCELDRFDNYDAWELTLRGPHGPKALTWAWVLEMRSGELKARLCAGPFGMQINKSKSELYCPTPLSFSFKLLMVYAKVKDFAIYLFDISRAFLHTPIRELVYAEVPKEYCHSPDSSDLVFKINKTVYGLNEAMIYVDDHFENIATGRSDESNMIFKRCLSDPCAFADRTNQVAMAKHVDDGTLVGPRVSASRVLEELGTHFLLKVSELTVGGPDIKHLGRGWLRTPEGIQVRMWPAIVKKLLGSEPNDTKTSPIPRIKNERKVESEEESGATAATRFRSINGLNMFVCLERPECQHAATVQAEFNALVHVGIEARGAQTYLKKLLDDAAPVTLESDNSSALTNVEKKGVGRMRHIELKDLWIKDLVARKSETKVSTNKVHTEENTPDTGAKHLSRIDCTKHLTALKARLTGKGDESHFGYSTTVVMMMLTLLSVIAASAAFKVKQHIDRVMQPAQKDAPTQYSLKDTMKNGATSKIVANDLRAMFTAMTIDSGREFLRLRRVDRAISTYTKAMVVEACVATALNKIRQDNIYS